MTTTTEARALKTVGFENKYDGVEIKLTFKGAAAIEQAIAALMASDAEDARRVGLALGKGLANSREKVDTEEARALALAIVPDAYLVAAAERLHTFGWGGQAKSPDRAAQLHAVDAFRQSLCGKRILDVDDQIKTGTFHAEHRRSFEAAMQVDLTSREHEGWSAREFAGKLCPACREAIAALTPEVLERDRAFAVEEIARRAEVRVADASKAAASKRASL